MTKPVLALVPRTLEAQLARYAAPEAPGHARDSEIDQALLVTTATELKALKELVQKQGEEIDKWKRRVTDLEAREHV